VSRSFASLDGRAVQKSLARGFALREISGSFERSVPAWVEAFAAFVARRSVGSADDPTFLQSALDHAGVRGAAKRERVARLFLEQGGLTPALIAAAKRDRTLTKAQLADVQTSFRLADLTGGGFDLVRTVKEQFGVRRSSSSRQAEPPASSPRRCGRPQSAGERDSRRRRSTARRWPGRSRRRIRRWPSSAGSSGL
jgi:hypothetical protein